MATPDKPEVVAQPGPYKSSYKKSYTISPITIAIEETEDSTHPPAPCGCGGGKSGVNIADILQVLGEKFTTMYGAASSAVPPQPWPPEDSGEGHTH